jgi:hypothetical protein
LNQAEEGFQATGDRDREVKKENMLHILSLLVLPCLISTAEAKGVSLFLCLREGCSGPDVFLLHALVTLPLTCIYVVFILVTMCHCLCDCYNGRREEDEDEFETV